MYYNITINSFIIEKITIVSNKYICKTLLSELDKYGYVTVKGHKTNLSGKGNYLFSTIYKGDNENVPLDIRKMYYNIRVLLSKYNINRLLNKK